VGWGGYGQGKGAVKLALMLYYTCRCGVWLLWLAGRDVVTELAATLPKVSLHVMSGGFARGVTLRTCCVLQLDPPSIITCCTCLGLHVYHGIAFTAGSAALFGMGAGHGAVVIAAGQAV
jgi:hypothetical protein